MQKRYVLSQQREQEKEAGVIDDETGDSTEELEVMESRRWDEADEVKEEASSRDVGEAY